MLSAPFRRLAPAAFRPFCRAFSSTYYFRSHEWITVEQGNQATLGVTDFAQSQLGEVVYIDLPAAGDAFDAGNVLITLESVKAVGEVYAPCALEVIECNPQFDDEANFTLVNKDAEGAGWLLKVKTTGKFADSMTLKEYKAFCDSEEH